MSKKETTLQLNFKETNTSAEPRLEIFTNSFNYHSDDYFHKNTGSLFGVIQVSDHSKNSEYLPNLLTSIIKKSFYSHSKKTTEENFEASLKKANLALADLAEHDIVEWNNNLQAMVGVFNNSSILFTQVGNILILLGRDDRLINLSEPISSANIHPIKTFKDVVVGEVQSDDKIIIATSAILDIFNMEDLSRLFKTFSSKEFDELLLKTITKEGVNVNALIINITSEQKTDYSKNDFLGNKNVPLAELTKNTNFLGEDIKQKKKKSIPAKKKKSPVKKLSQKQSLDLAQKNTDKTTFLDNDTSGDTTKKKSTKDKKSQSKKNKKVSNKKKIKNNNFTTVAKTIRKKEEKKEIKKVSTKLNDLKPAKKKNSSAKLSPFEELQDIYIKDDDLIKKAKKPSSKKLKSFFKTKPGKITPTKLKSISAVKTKLAKNTKQLQSKLSPKKNISTKSIETKKQNLFSKNKTKKIYKKIINLLPAEGHLFSKIKKIIKSFIQKITPSVKKYYKILFLIIFLIAVPFIIGKLKHSPAQNETLEKLKVPDKSQITTKKETVKDKNKTNQIALLPTNISLIADNAKIIIAYTEDSQLYQIDKKTNTIITLKLPESLSLSEIKAIDYIASLNLFFLSSDKTTISYSPKVKKFIPNKITLPDNFNLAGQNTYLSYLYLLDKTSKQIYRYPRTTGGFATSKQWLKKPFNNNAEPSAMAIDENVRISYKDGTVEKYSRGKLLNSKKFNLESIDFMETTANLKSYYLLSKKDGKILKISKKTDKIEKEYQNSSIQKTRTISVDEKKELLYIFDDKQILSIDL